MIKHDYSRSIITELDRRRDDRVAGWISLILSAALAAFVFYFGGPI